MWVESGEGQSGLLRWPGVGGEWVGQTGVGSLCKQLSGRCPRSLGESEPVPTGVAVQAGPQPLPSLT